MGIFEAHYRRGFAERYGNKLFRSYLQNLGKNGIDELTEEESENFALFLDWASQAHCNWVILKAIMRKEINFHVRGKYALSRSYYKHLLHFDISNTPKWKGAPNMPDSFLQAITSLVEPRAEESEND